MPDAQLPIDIKLVSGEDIDKQICRAGMIAELDATSLYEQMAAKAVDKRLKKVLLDIAKEEKTHMGEFQAMLLRFDAEQKTELVKGAQEVEDLVGKP